MEKTTDEIIKSHIIFSITAGAIPIPLIDIASVTAIQIDLLKQLAKFYSIEYDEHKGKSFASSLAGATFARIGASLIKAIPGVGTLLGLGSQAILSGASTYALGKIFDSHFSENGDFNNFNLDSMKEQYQKLIQSGKDVAKDIKNNLKNDDVYETIEKLNELKEKGALSETEYQKTKEKLLKKIS